MRFDGSSWRPAIVAWDGLFNYLYIFLLISLKRKGFDEYVAVSRGRLVGRCANSGAASHCRLIFERLAYTRLVLKKFIARHNGAKERERERENMCVCVRVCVCESVSEREREGVGGEGRGDRVDKAADVIREIQGLSISNQRTWPTKHWPN